MKYLTIGVTNEEELQFLLMLFERLDVVIVEGESPEEEESIQEKQERIAAGPNLPESHLQERLKMLEEDREERPRPN